MKINQAYIIKVAAPGYRKEEFKVNDGGIVLGIGAEIRLESGDDHYSKKYSLSEYSYLSFRRSFHLPANVKQDEISVSLTDGILSRPILKEAQQPKPSNK